MPNKPGKVVFVGNIPYNLSEPRLVDVFNSVGRVVSFKLLFDRETGKPKGYGFCTFEDTETASCAVRNLNNVCIGGRQLRVDFSENEKDGAPAPRQVSMPEPAAPDLGSSASRPGSGQHEYPPPPLSTNAYQRVPPAVPQVFANLPPQERSTDAINNAIARHPTEQLIQALSQLKLLVHKNPDVARNLLMATPQLTYAVFQALLVTNIVEKRVIQWALQTAQFKGPLPQPPQAFGAFPVNARADRHSAFTDSQPQDIPQPCDPAAQGQSFPANVNLRVPPPIMHYQQQQGIQANPARAPMPQSRPQDPTQEQQERLLHQILSLTPEQIMSLQEDQKNSVNRLRARLLNARRDDVGNIQ